MYGLRGAIALQDFEKPNTSMYIYIEVQNFVPKI